MILAARPSLRWGRPVTTNCTRAALHMLRSCIDTAGRRGSSLLLACYVWHTSTHRIGGDVVDHDFTLGEKLFEVPVTPVHAERKLRFAETAGVPHGIG